MDGETTGENVSDDEVIISPVQLHEGAMEYQNRLTHAEVDAAAILDENEGVPPTKEFVFSCCICNRVLKDGELFELDLVWPNDKRGVTWWVHFGCITQMIHPFHREGLDD